MDIGGVENVITGNVINRTHDTLPGIDLTGADNNVVSNNLIQNAGTDGILLAADADANVITGNRITGSGGYGVNISASTVDDTILSQNSLAGNTTAAFQDLGTNSQIGLNVTS